MGKGSRFILFMGEKKRVSQALFKRDRIGLEFSSFCSIFLLEACSFQNSNSLILKWGLHMEHIAYSIGSKISSRGSKRKMYIEYAVQWKTFMDSGISYLLAVKFTLFMNVLQLHTRNSVEIGFFVRYLILLCVVYSVLCCDCTECM